MRSLLIILVIGVSAIMPSGSLAQSDSVRLNELERRVTQLEGHPGGRDAAGGVAFVCGALCALWAQQTGRSAWLWFFLGLFFSVITLLFLLYKNSKDKETRRGETAGQFG